MERETKKIYKRKAYFIQYIIYQYYISIYTIFYIVCFYIVFHSYRPHSKCMLNIHIEINKQRKKAKTKRIEKECDNYEYSNIVSDRRELKCLFVIRERITCKMYTQVSSTFYSNVLLWRHQIDSRFVYDTFLRIKII